MCFSVGVVSQTWKGSIRILTVFHRCQQSMWHRTTVDYRNMCAYFAVYFPHDRDTDNTHPADWSTTHNTRLAGCSTTRDSPDWNHATAFRHFAMLNVNWMVSCATHCSDYFCLTFCLCWFNFLFFFVSKIKFGDSAIAGQYTVHSNITESRISQMNSVTHRCAAIRTKLRNIDLVTELF